MKILILVDLQNDFIDGVLGSEEAQGIVPKVVSYIEKHKDDYDLIYATRDTHTKERNDSVESKRLPAHCVHGTTGHLIVPSIYDILPPGNTHVMNKYTFMANIPISSLPDGTEVDICGLCTDICVVSTALYIRAVSPNSEINCLADLCAGTTHVNHLSALNVMNSCLINIKNGL